MEKLAKDLNVGKEKSFCSQQIATNVHYSLHQTKIRQIVYKLFVGRILRIQLMEKDASNQFAVREKLLPKQGIAMSVQISQFLILSQINVKSPNVDLIR